MNTDLCQWITRMRKPGMTIQYTLNKQHIPDMDQPRDEAGDTSLPCDCGCGAGQQQGNGSSAAGGKNRGADSAASTQGGTAKRAEGRADSTSSADNSQTAPQGGSQSGSQACTCTTTGSSESMGMSGSLSIRYFDLAVGAMLTMVACGMIKCCCACCHCLTRKIF